MATRKTRNRRWKAIEYAVAKFWSGTRASYKAYDIVHPWLNIEVKSREKPPTVWMERWLQQAEASAPTMTVPIVQMHIIGDRHVNDIVLIRAKDLREALNATQAT
jgi:hypothetical protein